MQQRAGLVAVDVHVGAGPTLLERRVHGGCSRAVLGGGKRTCVAVGENSHGLAGLSHLLHDLEANCADVAANLHVLLADAQRLLEELLLELIDRQVKVVTAERVHAVEGPEEVDCRGTRCCQVVRDLLELAVELLLVGGINLVGENRKTLGRSHANGRGTTHAQLLDGFPKLLLGTKVDALHRTGKKRLVDDVQRLAVLRQLHRENAVEEVLYAHMVLSPLPSYGRPGRAVPPQADPMPTCLPYQTRP